MLDRVYVCLCWCDCEPNSVFVWKMAGQTERVMTTDMLSIFQTDRIRWVRGGGRARQIGHGAGELIYT